MKNYTLFDRLDPKSFNGLLAGRLQNHYRLSPAAAQTISQDTVILRNLFGHSTRKDGQVIYFAVKLGKLAQPVRVALTGGTVSPGIYDVIEVMGKEKVLRRIAAAVAMIGN